MKDEADLFCVAEWSKLGNEIGIIFIVQYFMNSSIVCGKPQKEAEMILNIKTHLNAQMHLSHPTLSVWGSVTLYKTIFGLQTQVNPLNNIIFF